MVDIILKYGMLLGAITIVVFVTLGMILKLYFEEDMRRRYNAALLEKPSDKNCH